MVPLTEDKPLLTFIGRIKSFTNRVGDLLSINQRNLLYVYRYNQRSHFPLADNKILTKELLTPLGIPMPITFRVYDYFYEIRNLDKDLASYPEFVIKPSRGKQGGGVTVITGREKGLYVRTGGQTYSPGEIKKVAADIIFGVYSFGLKDTAIVEERVGNHPAMDELSSNGLADIRIILCENRPILSMARVPTEISKGRANLHQGALGLGLDLQKGLTTHGIHRGRSVSTHPDTGTPLLGFKIPFWKEVLEISRETSRALPLKYLGVDIAVSKVGPVLLEANARPGLEIQNANMVGLRKLLYGTGK